MYYEYFGLNNNPFRNTPDTRVFFEGGKRGSILEALEYAISQGEGILKVVGEVGSGKTTLCRMLETRLSKTVETVFLANPSLTPENIFHAIAVDLRIPHSASSDKLSVMQLLHEFLLKKHGEGRQVVVLVEEAQGMPLATLEEIRLLSNLETRQSKLLQLVLFGQPELDENLSVPSIRQLRERISYQFYLSPFDLDEVKEYLVFRLRGAGYRGPVPFSSGAIKKIRKLSNGLSRRINLLADKSMLAAFIDKKDSVTAKHVAKAADESSFIPVRNWHQIVLKLAIIMVIAVPVAGFVGYQMAKKDGLLSSISSIVNGGEESQYVSSSQPENRQKVVQPTAALVVPKPKTVVVNTVPDVKYDKLPTKDVKLIDVIKPLKSILIDVKPEQDAEKNKITAEAVAKTAEAVATEEIDSKISYENPLYSIDQLAFLNERLQSTQNWLQKSDKKLYTIQIMLASDRKTYWLNRVIADHGHNNYTFYIKRIKYQDRTHFIIYLNEYDSYKAALNEINNLPRYFQKSGPFVAEIATIRPMIGQ
ncbi:MAG: AAA family ATPase [Magnetococcales bacterium]|nr:AAA family ATPase [Magnetococcales bacterium]